MEKIFHEISNIPDMRYVDWDGNILNPPYQPLHKKTDILREYLLSLGCNDLFEKTPNFFAYGVEFDPKNSEYWNGFVPDDIKNPRGKIILGAYNPLDNKDVESFSGITSQYFEKRNKNSKYYLQTEDAKEAIGYFFNI